MFMNSGKIIRESERLLSLITNVYLSRIYFRFLYYLFIYQSICLYQPFHELFQFFIPQSTHIYMFEFVHVCLSVYLSMC